MYETLLLDKKDNGVAVIQLNRPDAMNALNSVLMAEMIALLGELEGDDTVRCVVITGNEKVFAAGADIKDMANASAVDMLYRNMSMWDVVGAFPKPIIAAVSGVCLGGGCELVMACDIIIASEKAKFGQPEINLGVIPGAGGTQRLTRVVGKHLAMEMILNNRWLTAEEAKQHGLANHVFPVDSYLDEALKLAGEIAARAPVAVRMGKESVNKAFESTLAEGVKFERRAFAFLFSTDDQTEGMDAFVNKREADWKGR